MNLFHYLFPQGFGQVQLCPVHTQLGIIVVIAGPGCGCVIGGISGEPYIQVIGSGTGFIGNGHAAEIDGSTGSADYRILHCIGQQKGSGFLDNLSADGLGIIQNNGSVVVYNLGIKLRLQIGTAVGNGSVGCI